MLTAQNEAKAKETKNCDKASINEVKKIIMGGVSPALDLGRSIMNRIAQFITGSETATFAPGDAWFASAEAFTSAVKKCDPSRMERQFIQTVANQVNQKTVEGKDGNVIQQGEILQKISNSANANANLPFFPYFKLLFKMCQIGMTMKKKQALEMKQVTADQFIKDKEVAIISSRGLVSNLDFHQRITAQVQRTTEEDIAAIVSK